VFRCGYCHDLHFATDQARRCAACGRDWVTDAEAEARRQEARGPVPWEWKIAVRSSQAWTPTERALWRVLKDALSPDTLFSQWWLNGTHYRVDFLVRPIGLVVEVDGRLHRGREGQDRLRSADIHAQGFDIFRVDADDVRRHADIVTAQVVFRFETELEELPVESRVVA
jgi:very-short-patch-repair endonuclease